MIVRHAGDEIVGVTVLHASQHPELHRRRTSRDCNAGERTLRYRLYNPEVWRALPVLITKRVPSKPARTSAAGTRTTAL